MGHGVSPVTVAVIFAPGCVSERVADAVRRAGAECAGSVGAPPNCDAIIHDCAPTFRIASLLRGRPGEHPLPILLVAPDGERVRQLLANPPDAIDPIRWVPIGQLGEAYALDEAVRHLVERASAVHAYRILMSANPEMPHHVHLIVRTFLMTVAEHRDVPVLGLLLRQVGMPPRTVERIWSRAGLPHPKRFMDRVLLLFLAIEAARVGEPVTGVARRLGVSPRSLQRLRQRTPGLKSLRDLYGEPGISALARSVSTVTDAQAPK